MSELEYQQAVYYKNGIKKTIKPEDLIDQNILHTAKTEFLMDISESLRLRPRIQKNKKPHFIAPDKTIIRTLLNVEKDPLHDAKLGEILCDLKKRNKWKVMIRFFRDGQLETEPKFILDDYSWEKEVHRITSSIAIVRHDIFGQTKRISMSIFEPWVAIEVINKHYPSPQTFDEMISLSANCPFIVFFDLVDTKKKNYFFKIDLKNNEITPLYYIYNGKVWKGGSILEKITDSTMLEIELKKHK